MSKIRFSYFGLSRCSSNAHASMHSPRYSRILLFKVLFSEFLPDEMTFHLIYSESFRVALLFICQGTRKAVVCARTFWQARLLKMFLVQRTILRQHTASKSPYELAFLLLPAFCCRSQRQLAYYIITVSACQQLFWNIFKTFFVSNISLCSREHFWYLIRPVSFCQQVFLY